MAAPFRFVLFAAAGLVLAVSAAAQEAPQQKLQQVEQDLQDARKRRQAAEAEAARLDAELRAMRQKSVAAARALQRQEAAVSELEDRTAVLVRDEKAKLAALDSRRGELAATLSGLVRLGRQPPQALLLAPGSAIDTVRSTQLISAIVPQIEKRASALRDDLAALSDIRAQIQRDQERLGGEIAKLDEERRRLAALQAEIGRNRESALGESREEGKRAQLLADEARELRALIQRLREEEERRAAEDRRRAAERERAERERAREAARDGERQAALPPVREGVTINLPARGRVIGRFGEPDRNGAPRKGIDLETRPSAQVVAPADGKVVFAGQFKGYGLLLIISHGGGYHSLLAGLERIDSAVGRSVSAGEPVGQMGGSADKPQLYVEVRLKGDPVNPVPWLTAGDRKVNG